MLNNNKEKEGIIHDAKNQINSLHSDKTKMEENLFDLQKYVGLTNDNMDEKFD